MSIPTQNMPHCKTNVRQALSLSEGEERFSWVSKQRKSLTELPQFYKNPLLRNVAVTDFRTVVNTSIFHINSRRMNPVCIYLFITNCRSVLWNTDNCSVRGKNN